MTDPRAPIFDLLRPHLKNGWNDAGLIEQFSHELDLLGVPREPAEIAVMPPKPAAELTFAQAQIDLAFLTLAFPANSPAGLSPWVQPTQTACVRWGIDTYREVASFLANINVESAGLTRLVESLNYSSDALIQKFSRSRISVDDANLYGRNAQHPANEQALANILYGGEFGRKQLGNTEPGDGWLCRGYGPKQITGRDNQTRFATAMGMRFEDVAAYVHTPDGGMMSAGWFWKSHNVDAKAATPGVRDDRRAVNGGVFGLASVEHIFDLLVDELIRREKAG